MFWGFPLLFVKVCFSQKIGARGSENNSFKNLATFNQLHSPREKVVFERRVRREYWEEMG